jgi:hypothetical protein
MRNVVRTLLALTMALTSPAPALAGAPALSVAADGWHVNAVLPGTTVFTFVIKVTGEPDRYIHGQTSPFLVDPWDYGGKDVFVGARADDSASDPWASPGVTFKVAKGALTLAADHWYVNAVLPGTHVFTFVVKSDGLPDKYIGGQTSSFLVDPVTYNGRVVRVGAKDDTAVSKPWANEVTFTVSAQPVVSVGTDNWHVYATLPGTDRFTFVVKVAGMPDAYFGNQPSPFAIDRQSFGGREVSVAARADLPSSMPWTAVPQHFIVPAVKQYGVVDILSGKPGAAADATAMGARINRIDFSYGATQSDMDALIAANTSSGLVPLVILNQHGDISQFDVDGWKTWTSSVVARYGPNGAFWAGRSDAQYAPVYFEVLNEPYGWWFNQPVDPGAYAHFFAEVVTAAKAANPKARFLLAGLPKPFKINENGPWGSATWDAVLKSSADGARAQSLADGVTVHPYGSYTSASGWQTAVTTHTDFPQLPVWITEVGYRLCVNADDTGCVIDGVRVTEAEQGQWLTRDLNDFASWPWAAAFIWFKWTDYYGPDPLNEWGLVRWADGSHRPAYTAYQSFIATH